MPGVRLPPRERPPVFRAARRGRSFLDFAHRLNSLTSRFETATISIRT